MVLTEKDRSFLLKLRELMDDDILKVELAPNIVSRMVLKGTYNSKVHRIFGLSRQGVRWRFLHIFNDEYVRAFETIVFIERLFGVDLRGHAVRISKERYENCYGHLNDKTENL